MGSPSSTSTTGAQDVHALIPTFKNRDRETFGSLEYQAVCLLYNCRSILMYDTLNMRPRSGLFILKTLLVRNILAWANQNIKSLPGRPSYTFHRYTTFEYAELINSCPNHFLALFSIFLSYATRKVFTRYSVLEVIPYHPLRSSLSFRCTRMKCGDHSPVSCFLESGPWHMEIQV
jgi:hypothetical protein